MNITIWHTNNNLFVYARLLFCRRKLGRRHVQRVVPVPVRLPSRRRRTRKQMRSKSQSQPPRKRKTTKTRYRYGYTPKPLSWLIQLIICFLFATRALLENSYRISHSVVYPVQILRKRKRRTKMRRASWSPTSATGQTSSTTAGHRHSPSSRYLLIRWISFHHYHSLLRTYTRTLFIHFRTI